MVPPPVSTSCPGSGGLWDNRGWEVTVLLLYTLYFSVSLACAFFVINGICLPFQHYTEQ